MEGVDFEANSPNRLLLAAANDRFSLSSFSAKRAPNYQIDITGDPNISEENIDNKEDTLDLDSYNEELEVMKSTAANWSKIVEKEKKQISVSKNTLYFAL